MESAKKTYKREVSFGIMSVEIGLILAAAVVDDPAHAERLFKLAQFLMPFSSALLAGAFGADWWSKQEVKK